MYIFGSFIFICIFVIIFLFIVITFLSLVGKMIEDVPFVPVKDSALETIIETLNLNNDSILIDIGCGDGKVLLKASEKFPITKMIGIEKSPLPYLIARWKTRSYKNITIHNADFYTYDFSSATHVYAYLFPQVLNRLLPKLEKILKPKTRFVSCDFEFAQKAPLEKFSISGNEKNKLSKEFYVYEF